MEEREEIQVELHGVRSRLKTTLIILDPERIGKDWRQVDF